MKNPFVILLLSAVFTAGMIQYIHADNISVYGKLKDDNDLDGSVDSVSFSPDGTMLASAYNIRVGASPWISKRSGQGGTIKGYVILWDVNTKKKIDTITCSGYICCVAFSPDGKLLAAAHSDEQGKQKVRLIDAATRKDRYSLSIEEDKVLTRSVSAIVFYPDGKKFIVGTTGYPKGAELIIFDLELGNRQSTLKVGEMSLSSLSFSLDGKLLTSNSENIVKVWDISKDKERNSFSVGRGNLSVMSPDGDTIAVSTTGSRNYPGKVGLTLHDAKTGKERIDFKCLRTGTTILFTPDGKNIIYGYAGIISFFDSTTGKRMWSTDGPNFSSMAVTRKGNLIATGNNSGTVWLWEIGAHKQLHEK